MKRSGQGGAIYLDGVKVGQTTGWSYSEDQSPIDQPGTADTSGSVDFMFDEGIATQLTEVGTRLDIEIQTSAAKPNRLLIRDAQIVSRSVNSSVNTIVTGSISFTSIYSVTYP